MEPDSGLARIFEGVKGFTQCPCRPMGRIVAQYAQGVKEVGDYDAASTAQALKELHGDKKIMLLPGKHEIAVRQPWYKDYVEKAILEPGEVHTIELSLAKDVRTPPKDATGELKIAATPERAAVFVDAQFAGHADEFNGHGKAMLLTPGEHRVRIALPGYLPFETTVDLRPYQKLKIQTELVKGSVVEAGSLVSKN